MEVAFLQRLEGSQAREDLLLDEDRAALVVAFLKDRNARGKLFQLLFKDPIEGAAAISSPKESFSALLRVFTRFSEWASQSLRGHAITWVLEDLLGRVHIPGNARDEKPGSSRAFEALALKHLAFIKQGGCGHFFAICILGAPSIIYRFLWKATLDAASSQDLKALLCAGDGVFLEFLVDSLAKMPMISAAEIYLAVGKTFKEWTGKELPQSDPQPPNSSAINAPPPLPSFLLNPSAGPKVAAINQAKYSLMFPNPEPSPYSKDGESCCGEFLTGLFIALLLVAIYRVLLKIRPWLKRHFLRY